MKVPNSVVTISEYTIGIDLDKLCTLWLNKNSYEKFLIEVLKDRKVNMDEWICSEESTYKRTVSTHHPSMINFPGMPSYTENIRQQTIYFNIPTVDNAEAVIIHESNSFRGIPYSDYFTVQIYWTLTEVKIVTDEEDLCSKDSGIISKLDSVDSNVECQISIGVECIFTKSTWLQSTIESNTKAELVVVFSKWRDYILQLQSSMQLPSPTSTNILSIKNMRAKNRSNTVLSNARNNDDGAITTTSKDVSSKPLSSNSSIIPTKEYQQPPSSSSIFKFNGNRHSNNTSQPASSHGAVDYSTDDEYYDCEEGVVNLKEDLHNILEAQRLLGHDSYANYSWQINKTSSTGSTSSRNTDTALEGEETVEDAQSMSRKAVILNAAGILFVLLEACMWQCHRIYNSELRQLLNVLPQDVVRRFLCSLVPGYHGPILSSPDLYGPLVAVFLMPQVLLGIMQDVALHGRENGCDRSSLLGNSVVVTICLWLGLSSIYRLLSYLVAPDIEFAQCCCMTGYSFFSWSLSLVLSHLFDTFQDFLGLSSSIPLALFGIPSAIAIGYIFWEQTPLSSMTITIQATGSSAHRPYVCSSRVRSFFGVLLQRLLWAIPKIVVFLVVAGTHYQFLWYVARVFLPGKRQLCKLSALMKPAQYADILTQKELRKYALMLLKKSYEKHTHI